MDYLNIQVFNWLLVSRVVCAHLEPDSQSWKNGNVNLMHFESDLLIWNISNSDVSAKGLYHIPCSSTIYGIFDITYTVKVNWPSADGSWLLQRYIYIAGSAFIRWIFESYKMTGRQIWIWWTEQYFGISHSANVTFKFLVFQTKF